MSSAPAAATVRNGVSVVESMTSIVRLVDGGTHSPPMKNASGFPTTLRDQ
jgi:hypothetical protein